MNTEPADFDALSRLLHARHSCRAFLPDAVPAETTSRIVEAAGRVPSWCNAQPWQVLVTSQKETDRLRPALYEHAQSTPPNPDLDWPTAYPDVYGDRRRTCGWQLYDAVGVKKGDRAASARQMMENYRLFGAPHVAILHSPAALGPYGAMDCGGFVAAFSLAAQALGVAAIPQAALAAYAPFLRDWFNLPQGRLILCAISFGYSDTEHPANAFRTERAEVTDILEFR